MNSNLKREMGPHILDFEECPQPLDDHGRVGWAEIMENRALRAAAEECATCGGRPCANPSFCDACRKADAHHQEPRPSRLPANWDEMSLVALWRHHNSNRPTPQATIEAVMHCVRERGLSALQEPATLERLSRCDAAALAQIDDRIVKLRI
ncbi:MAG: hypothetical protein ACXWJ4_11810 [Methyloceanibacter sp.]